MEIKAKVNKGDLIKSFCTAKETINKVKRTLQMGENSKWNSWQRINFQNIQAANTTQYQKNKQPNQKWGKDLNRHFFKEDIQMANKHMKRCSIALIIREMKIKTAMRSHLTLVRMTIMKKSTNNKWRRGCGEKRTLVHCWWECKLIQPLWKMVWRFLKKTRNKITIWPSNPTLRHIPWGNQGWKRHMYPIVHCSSIYNS